MDSGVSAHDVELKFPGAEQSRLVWQQGNGIESLKDPPSYLAMINYPAVVHVSRDGAAMIDYWFNERGRYSSVDVYATTALDQRFGMFTLNINFMGHLQALLRNEKAWSADKHGKMWTNVERQYFLYSPEDNSFSTHEKCNQCSLCLSYRDKQFDASSPITKFGAELLVGTASGADETFVFEQVDATVNCRYGLVLVIDGDVEKKTFALQLLDTPR